MAFGVWVCSIVKTILSEMFVFCFALFCFVFHNHGDLLMLSHNPIGGLGSQVENKCSAQFQQRLISDALWAFKPHHIDL